MSRVFLILGSAVLVVGGELLVRGATAVSVRMGISPMVVGLTVVAIGSSLPELAVGIDAALRGSTGLVTGNIVGTNIVNLLLILGISAAMRPIRSGRQTMRLDLPAVVIVAALLLLLSLGGSLGRTSGVLLLVVGVIYTGLILWYVRQQARRPEPAAAPDNVVEAGTDAAAAADTAGTPRVAQHSPRHRLPGRRYRGPSSSARTGWSPAPSTSPRNSGSRTRSSA
jgi:cation:H+ antiporter